MDKELAILRARLPEVDAQLAAQVVSAVQKLRASEAILKKPSIAETLDWAQALDALGVRELTPELMRSTVGFVLKNNEDIETMAELFGAACADCDKHADGSPCDHDHAACGHHHHA